MNNNNNNNNNFSTLQPLVGFGFLRNTPPACFVPLQSLATITAKSIAAHHTVNHLVCGCALLIQENNHSFSILSGIYSLNILIMCPSHLILCVFTNLTMSRPSNSSFNSTLQQFLHSPLCYTGPKIFPNILLVKNLRAFSSSTVSDHISVPQGTTGLTSVL